MAIRHTADIDGVGHSKIFNWLFGTSLNEDLEPALLGHFYFDVSPTNNFFGGRGALSIRDNLGTGSFSRLAPGIVGDTGVPNDTDRIRTTDDGTAPIRFGGNIINARANWAKLLDEARHLTLTGKAIGSTITPFRGDAMAAIDVTRLILDIGGPIGTGDLLKLPHLHLFTGNTGGNAEAVMRDTIKLNEWGIPSNHVRMGTDDWVTKYRIINMADPVNLQDAVTLKYLQDNASGIEIRTAVRLATNGPLPANTFTVGTNTIEANVVGGPLQIDVTPVLPGDRVLIKDESDKIRQGIYDVVLVGDGATKWKLTRSSDSDTTPELQPGMYYTVIAGTVNAGSPWVQSSPKPFTLNVDPCLFALFSNSGGYLAGQGIVIDGKTIHFVRKDPYLAKYSIPYTNWNQNGINLSVAQTAGTFGQPFLSGNPGAADGVDPPHFGPLDLSVLTNTTGNLPVDRGGTGRGSLTQYNVLLGAGVAGIGFAAPGTAGFALLSNGATANPSFQQITSSMVSGLMKKFIGVLASGATTVTLAHGLGNKNVEVYVARNTTPFDNVICDVAIDATNVTVAFKGPAPADFNITVIG